MTASKKRYTRRQVIRSLASSSLLLPGIVGQLLADEDRRQVPHFAAGAKRVIFLYMRGGASHLDTFDPKPRLVADNGKRVPWHGPEDPVMVTQQDQKEKVLLASKRKFRPHGQCGMEVSELFPHLAQCVDDLCLIRSMRTDNKNHSEANLGLHTGSFTAARPSMGAWISYGLGTVNKNLPSFVVIAPDLPHGSGLLLSSDFLPGRHQGTYIRPGAEPIPNLRRGMPSAELQEMQLGLLEAFNGKHLATRGADPALAARIKSFETAAGMQLAAPEAFDLSREDDQTLRLYGLQRGSKEGFAWQCLVARRLAERGVRFIELVDSHPSWDSHTSIDDDAKPAKNVDQPIAGLLKDLKARGMLEETLVVWTTEFGRPPFTDASEPQYQGRGHNETAFASWLAGGGVKGGMVHGATDEYGLRVVEKPVHVHDLHATILRLMGLDHTRLTFRHGGRDQSLTDADVTKARVVSELLA